MPRKRFTEEQITRALRQAEAGTPVREVCRDLGIAEPTFYRWKKRFGSLGVRPARRRELVDWAQAAFQISQRRPCAVLGSARSSMRYCSVRPHQEALRGRIREIATVRVRYGYRRRQPK